MEVIFWKENNQISTELQSLINAIKERSFENTTERLALMRTGMHRMHLAGFPWGNHLFTKIWRTNRTGEESVLGSCLGRGATCAKALR